METTQVSFSHSSWENLMGETHKDALRLNFDRKLKLEFHGMIHGIAERLTL
jgi:hypothetical protein